MIIPITYSDFFSMAGIVQKNKGLTWVLSDKPLECKNSYICERIGENVYLVGYNPADTEKSDLKPVVRWNDRIRYPEVD